MFSDFLTSFKNVGGKEAPQDIADIKLEKIKIISGLPAVIKNILEEAYLIEHKQKKTRDLAKRREFCADALIKYQQAIDKMNLELKRAKKTQMQADSDMYSTELSYITERMDYLEAIRKNLKNQIKEMAA